MREFNQVMEHLRSADFGGRMEENKKLVDLVSYNGDPVQYGDTVITPVSQAMTVRLPFFDFTWNRPKEIHVQDGESESTIQHVNVTRAAQIAIFAFGAGIVILLWLLSRISGRK